ncbi:MAG: efflux RND transporter permease subunit [Planctomycetota bacterium]|nr:MAG: efflux RND transporter permease subunit [Planctomycetota bacterium]
MNLTELGVKNPTFVHIFTFTLVVVGGYFGLHLTREMFPQTDPSVIAIDTLYPGSNPEEVERSISVKIEDKVKELDGIDTLYSTSTEDGSFVRLKLEEGYRRVDELLSEVKNEVDKITDFPKDAQKPNIQLMRPLFPVIAFSIYGDVREETLKKIGQKAKEDLLLIPGLTNVELSGIRKSEIAFDVPLENSVRFQLTPLELAGFIRRSNLELAGGKLRSDRREILVRTDGERYRAKDLARLPFRATGAGGVLPVRYFANVYEAYEETYNYGRFGGKRAVSLHVFKTPEQDALEIARKVKEYIHVLERRLPSSLKVGIHSDLSKYIWQRLDLMLRNGKFGLILVFFSLVLFLNLVLSIWVASGLVVSFLGTFILMDLLGVTINLISLFGLIVVLGMLVDDAIIVGENIYRHMEEGKGAFRAAIEGAREVSLPVTSAVLTTVVAFLPLLMMEGSMGEFMRVLPIVVACALGLSLFEALFILPVHLVETLNPKKVRNPYQGSVNEDFLALPWWRRLRLRQLYFLNVFGKDSLAKILKKILPYRYVVVVSVVCLTVISGIGGAILVPFVVMPKVDSDTIQINVNMPTGTPVHRTEKVVRVLEGEVIKLPEVKSVYTLLGEQIGFSMAGLSILGSGSEVGQILVELKEPEQRERTAFEIIRQLQKRAAKISGVESIQFDTIQGGPRGKDIEIELQGEDFPTLKKAAEYIKGRLRRYDGVFNIADDFQMGKWEVVISLSESGRALGLDVEQLAQQIRAAYYGVEADKFYRGREEVKLRVRLPREEREGIWHLERLRIRTPQGGMVFLEDVARLRWRRAYLVIKRTDQNRTITVSAEVDYKKNTPSKVIEDMEKKLGEFHRKFPSIHRRYKGEKLESQKSVRSLIRAFFAAIFFIYCILATQFRSYVQPLVIMFSIPFAIVGAVFGHVFMGYNLTLLSLIGLVALTGIVVNDSLVLVDFINRKVREGVRPLEAVIESCKQRLRPILLTSITTILGLAPLMLEQSMQARFLIPMAISITFGLLFATMLTLLVIPCLYLIVVDIQGIFKALFEFCFPPRSKEGG